MDHRYIDENNIGDLYLMGKLSAQERAIFEMHFINCERCVEMLEETSSLRQAIRGNWPQEILQTANPLPVRAVARPVWRTVVMACLLALLVIVPAIFVIEEMRRLRRELEEAKAIYAAQREPQNADEKEPSTDQKPTPFSERQGNDQREKSESNSSNTAKLRDSRSQTNTPVFALAAARRGEADSNEIITDESQKWLLISLDLEGDAEHETYRATIESRGRRFWRADDLRPNQYNALTISFRSDSLPSGQYLLTLEGISKTGEMKAIANYPFRVTKKSMK